MPELPEVETVRIGAEPHLVGRRLSSLKLQRDDLRWPMPKAPLQGLVGRICTSVARRSKYLLVHFDGPKAPIALIHLGMTGRMIVDVVGPRARRPEYRKHEHWRMDFGDRLVRFVDPAFAQSQTSKRCRNSRICSAIADTAEAARLRMAPSLYRAARSCLVHQGGLSAAFSSLLDPSIDIRRSLRPIRHPNLLRVGE